MVEEICFLKMGNDTMGNSAKINFQVLEFSFGLMEGDIRVHGKMVFNKVKEFIERFQGLF